MLDNINGDAKYVTDILYQCARSSKREAREQGENTTLERRERLIENKDDLQLWRAITWNGEYEGENKSNVCPSDDEFKNYFESNFNPPNIVRLTDCDFSSDVSIPLLDDLLTQ